MLVAAGLPAAWTHAVASSSGSTLVFDSQTTISAGTEYLIIMLLQNPNAAQSSPAIAVQARGACTLGCTLGPQEMDKDATTLLAAASSEIGDAMPLLVRSPSFVVRQFGQSNPFPSASNTITGTLVPNIQVPAGASVRLLSLTGTQTALASNLNFTQINGAHLGEAFSGVGWDQSTGTLTVVVAQNSRLEAGHAYVFSFVVTNPRWGQTAPDVAVDCVAAGSGQTLIEAASVVGDAAAPAGVVGAAAGDAFALKVQAPGFAMREIRQSTTFPSAVNMMAVVFSTNVDLVSNVTLAGLQGSDTASSATLPFLDSLSSGTASIFGSSCSAATPCAEWDAAAGTLTLVIASGQGLKAGVEYSLQFELLNPASSTRLRRTFVEGWAGEVCQGSARLVDSPFTRQLDRGVAAFTGLRIRGDAGIFNFRLRVVNATDTARVFASVLSDPFTVFPPELRLRSGLTAAFYVVSRDWWGGDGMEFELGAYSAAGGLLRSIVPGDGIEVQAQLWHRGHLVTPSSLGGGAKVLVSSGVVRFTLRFVETAGRDFAVRFFVVDAPREASVQTEAFAVVPSDLRLAQDSVDLFVRDGMRLRDIAVQAIDARGTVLDGILSSDEFFVIAKLLAGGVDISVDKLHGTTSQNLVAGATLFTDLSIVGAFGSDFTLEFAFSASGLSVSGATVTTNAFTIVPIDASVDFDARGLQIVGAILPTFSVTLLDSTGNRAVQSGGSQFVLEAHLYHNGALADTCLNGTGSGSPVNGVSQFDNLSVEQAAGSNFSIEFTLLRVDGGQAFATGVSVRSEAFTVVPYRIQAKLGSQSAFPGAQADLDQRGRIMSLSLQIDISDTAALPGIRIEAVDTQNRALNCSFSDDFPVNAAVFASGQDVSAVRLKGGAGVALTLPDSSALFTDLVITSRENLVLRFYLANVPCSFGSNCYDAPVTIVPFAAIGPHLANASQPLALQRFFASRSPTPSLSWVTTSWPVGTSTVLVEESRVRATFPEPATMVEWNLFCENGGTASCPGTPQRWAPLLSSENQSIFHVDIRPNNLEDSQLPINLHVKRIQNTELLYGLEEQDASIPTEFSLQVRGSTSSPGVNPKQSLAAQRTFELPNAPPSPQAAVVDRYMVSGTHARFKASDFEPNTQVWVDSSGNGRDAIVMEGFAELSQPGSSQSFGVVSGSADAFVLFPVDTLPASVTLCSLARPGLALGGEASGAVSAGQVWEHGLYVNASWLDGGAEEWRVQCGQNAGQQLRLTSNVSADFGWNASSAPHIDQPDVSTQLSINPARTLSWEIAEIVVWSRALTRAEMHAVMEHYKSVLADAATDEPPPLAPQIPESDRGYCPTRATVPCLAPSAEHVCTTGSTSLTGRSDAYDGGYAPSVGSTVLQSDYNAGDTVLRVASVAALGLTGDGMLRQPVVLYVGGGDNTLVAVGYDSAANRITVERDALSRTILADGANAVFLTETCSGAPSEVVVVEFQPAVGSEQIVIQMSQNGTENEPFSLGSPSSTFELDVALDQPRTMTYYSVLDGVSSVRSRLTFGVDLCKRQALPPCARNYICLNNPSAFSTDATFCVPRSPFSTVCTVSWPQILPYECAFSLRSPSSIYELVILSNGTMHVTRIDDGIVAWSAPASPILDNDVAVLRLYDDELRLQTQSAKVHLYPAVQHHALNAINRFEVDDNGTVAGYHGDVLGWESIGGDADGQGFGCHFGECCYSDRLAVQGTRSAIASDSPGSGIGCNGSVISANGLFALRVGADGALSINSTLDGSMVWRTAKAPTTDSAGYVLRLDVNGSVAVTARTSGEQIWPSPPTHPVRALAVAALVVENGGALVAYAANNSALWMSTPGDESGN